MDSNPLQCKQNLQFKLISINYSKLFKLNATIIGFTSLTYSNTNIRKSQRFNLKIFSLYGMNVFNYVTFMDDNPKKGLKRSTANINIADMRVQTLSLPSMYEYKYS